MNRKCELGMSHSEAIGQLIEEILKECIVIQRVFFDALVKDYSNSFLVHNKYISQYILVWVVIGV